MPKRAIDWDLLRQELSDHLVEGPQERYRLDWPGKREALLTAGAPIAKTLRPCRAESVDFDTTENLFVEGDNLDALKLLQESYLGKVKMIYIDPPYNTGKDFIYKDRFTIPSGEWRQQNHECDEDDNRLVVNTEANGRFHSDWLSMMYPRLKLARNLLRDDGLIFVSIGPEELNNLKNIINEIFGEENFRNSIAIKRGAKSIQAQFDTWDKLGVAFEYLLLYSKTSTYRFPKMERKLDGKKSGSWNNHWRGTDRPTMRYEIFGITPETGQWRWSQGRSLSAIDNYKRLLKDMEKDEQTILQEDIDNWFIKQDHEVDLLRLSSSGKPEHFIPPTNSTLLNDIWFHLPSGGNAAINQLMEFRAFDNPKPLDLIKQACKFCADDAIILDFFAGSATTAHAVMQLNAEDGGRRKFIMVQLPEPCYQKSEAFQAGYQTIADIAKERIRRAGQKIRSEMVPQDLLESLPASNSAKLDIGFRVLKVDSSNMAEVYYRPDATRQEELPLLAGNTKPERTTEDLLLQILLDWGLDLTLPISSEMICGLEVFFVDQNALAACFARNGEVGAEFCQQLARRDPNLLRAVFCDAGFADDSAKINAEQVFGQLAPHTELRCL